MRFRFLPLLAGFALTLVAQTSPKPATGRTTVPTKPKEAAQAQANSKANAEAQEARQAFESMLDAVNGAWFGNNYKDINAFEAKGSLTLEVTAKALNAKVEQATQGRLKGGVLQGGKAALTLTGTYFANGDFKTEMGGSFGSLLYTRTGNRGFIYNRAQNVYSTRVDLPPQDAPLTYLGWFRSVLNDLKAVYVDGPAFKATLGGEETTGGRTLQTLIFSAPTLAYDPKKREQSLDDTLGFWKRGKLQVVIEKGTRLPQRMNFSNEGQGIRSQMDFQYEAENRLREVTITNQSKGMEGPAFLRLAYGPDKRISTLSGELTSAGKKVAFSFDLTWHRDKKTDSIRSVPPPGATKKSREELDLGLIAGLAGNILELQRAGLNLRSIPLTAPK